MTHLPAQAAAISESAYEQRRKPFVVGNKILNAA
jgi:hypothetical protein